MTDIDTSHWSPTLKRCVQVIGAQDTLKLVRCCGGRENVYIPQRPHDRHPWAQAVGLDLFTLLSQEFGGTYVTIPLLRSLNNKKYLIVSLFEQGLGTHEIARRTRTSDRHVRRVVASLRVRD